MTSENLNKQEPNNNFVIGQEVICCKGTGSVKFGTRYTIKDDFKYFMEIEVVTTSNEKCYFGDCFLSIEDFIKKYRSDGRFILGDTIRFEPLYLLQFVEEFLEIGKEYEVVSIGSTTLKVTRNMKVDFAYKQQHFVKVEKENTILTKKSLKTTDPVPFYIVIKIVDDVCVVVSDRIYDEKSVGDIAWTLATITPGVLFTVVKSYATFETAPVTVIETYI